MKNIVKQFRVVGGIHGGVVFFSIGDWFALLGGVPDRNSIYVKLFDQEISK